MSVFAHILHFNVYPFDYHEWLASGERSMLKEVYVKGSSPISSIFFPPTFNNTAQTMTRDGDLILPTPVSK